MVGRRLHAYNCQHYPTLVDIEMPTPAPSSPKPQWRGFRGGWIYGQRRLLQGPV